MTTGLALGDPDDAARRVWHVLTETAGETLTTRARSLRMEAGTRKSAQDENLTTSGTLFRVTLVQETIRSPNLRSNH